MGNGGRGGRDRRGPESPGVALSDIAKRLDNMFRIGKVAKVNYDAARVRVQLGAKTLTDWIPWVVLSAGDDSEWRPLHVGEQVVVCGQSGNLGNGFVIGSLPTAAKKNGGSRGDTHRFTYGDKTVAFHEFVKSILTYRHFIGQEGTFRFEVGAGTDIIFDKNQICLRVGKTKLVIQESGISLHVNGNSSEILMNGGEIRSHVSGVTSTVLRRNLAETKVILRDNGTDYGKSFSRISFDEIDHNANGVSGLRLTNRSVDAFHASDGNNVTLGLSDRIRLENQGQMTMLELGEQAIMASQNTFFIANIRGAYVNGGGSAIEMQGKMMQLISDPLPLMVNGSIEPDWGFTSPTSQGQWFGDYALEYTAPPTQPKAPEFVDGKAPFYPEV